MSVLIKGMKMPKDCPYCPLAHWDFKNEFTGCEIVKKYFSTEEMYADGKPDFCPLVPVPPHGRLIDADELFKEMERKGWFDNADRDIAEDLVLATPTIIESTMGQVNSEKAVNEANANTSNAFNALDCVEESEAS